MSPTPDEDPHGMTVPYESDPAQGTIRLDNVHYSGGMVVLATVIPMQDGTHAAGLVYRFAKPDGSGFYDPIALVCDDTDLLLAGKLTTDAARDAIRRAKAERGPR